MTALEIRAMLGWCALINLGILLVWFAAFACCRDWVRRLHRRWFDLPDGPFDEIHYTLMGQYKLLVFVFNVIPYLALRIVL